MRLADIRKDYTLKSLEINDVSIDPLRQFKVWLDEAIDAEALEVNAMCLSTLGLDGFPNGRIVLLKELDHGFVFFTNYASAKGLQVDAHPHVAMNFFWKELERQVRITGTIKKVSKEESETYFHSRPIGSQLGAWSSPQSRIIPDRVFLEDLVAENTEKFKDGIIPLPPDWGGYIIHPTEIEFWQGRSSRLHDRLQYSLHDNGHWVKVRLAP
mgnify:FL=1